MNDIISNLNQIETSEIENIIQEHNVPGIVIGAFDRHRKFYITIGNSHNLMAVNENTSFRVASLTKPVFAYVVLNAVYDKKLELDTPLIEYYGEKYIEDDRIGKLTARLVLSHQSGWPNWAWNKPLEFEFEPGKKWQYSGEGYMYLQHVMKKLYGKEVFRQMKSVVYNPLEMRQSALLPQFLDTENTALPHDEEGLFMERDRTAIPEIIDYINRMARWGSAAGTMWASITDYISFLHHLMFSQDDRTTRIRELMWSDQVKINDKLSWGLGIGLDSVNGEKCAWHWGSDDGFKSFTLNFTESEKGITIFTNGENGFDVYKRIFEKILPEIPTFVENKFD